MPISKTIRIFLKDSYPNGIKVGKRFSLAFQYPRYHKLSNIKASKDLGALTEKAFDNG